jgi:hypothetical protein
MGSDTEDRAWNRLECVRIAASLQNNQFMKADEIVAEARLLHEFVMEADQKKEKSNA